MGYGVGLDGMGRDFKDLSMGGQVFYTAKFWTLYLYFWSKSAYSPNSKLENEIQDERNERKIGSMPHIII